MYALNLGFGLVSTIIGRNRSFQGIIPGDVGPKLVQLAITDHYPNWFILALSYNAKSVTGIDIDEDLLDHARLHLSFRYSRLYPTLAISRMKLPKDAYPSQSAPPEAMRDRLNYFPVSSIQKHGYLPYAGHVAGCGDSQEDSKNWGGVTPSFPLNVTFRKEDWGAFSVHEEATHNGQVKVPKEEYDVILALSVIKWLHLEHGDNGRCISTFLHNCNSAASPKLIPDTRLLPLTEHRGLKSRD